MTINKISPEDFAKVKTLLTVGTGDFLHLNKYPAISLMIEGDEVFLEKRPKKVVLSAPTFTMDYDRFLVGESNIKIYDTKSLKGIWLEPSDGKGPTEVVYVIPEDEIIDLSPYVEKEGE